MEIINPQSQSQKPKKNPRNPAKRRKIHEDFDHRVEVCSKEDGFLGSYYEAKVLGKVGRNKLMVEYKTLLSDEDGQQPLKEIVEAAEVRPVPPVILVTGFEVLDTVDAFDNDGWWVGRISGSYEDGKYFVYFESSGDELAYPIHRLRVHQEWEDGQWLVVR
ncbi:hypothetical protein AAG906_027007 [Vitis piasezkii]|uniref:DUF724 domain-containing protein 3 n=2 Tax=Vitis vinifera TaxID=29760 RepID=A0A438E5P1_VITVI|nr:protein AGENET DOMAIN (AGD)-CONTAINING P1 [Vitis vinifera]XP_034678844.1 protein AGENET DOMAIN (AGD)-CONTAINING P1 [Vitis riparia]RVW42983.1 DUF724 domain-containing protein 3 [Vitis vinifera]RVX03938.1 DUF724 domain-containing protein 3 [Vitis vinifera]WKA11998.1 hypothetical protein VitviT2T_029439 [Vitis vinifera]|eukprot:XP_002283128.1 PREDICTED: DUF724 domain-containing protein 2 [Vitis vinifera]